MVLLIMVLVFVDLGGRCLRQPLVEDVLVDVGLRSVGRSVGGSGGVGVCGCVGVGGGGGCSGGGVAG